MAWRRPGDKPLSEPRMESLLTHICVTRPQWVNLTMDIHISANRLRLGTRRFDLWVANLQMSCSDLTYRQGSRIVGAKVTCPNQTNSVGYECVQLFQKDIICKEVTLCRHFIFGCGQPTVRHTVNFKSRLGQCCWNNGRRSPNATHESTRRPKVLP